MRKKSRLHKDISTLVGGRISRIKKITGGGNNQAFYLQDEKGGEFCAKFYHADQEKRGSREFRTLKYLSRKGIKAIPQPLRENQARHLALYVFVKGEKIKSEAVTEKDLDQTVIFLTSLYRLGSDQKSHFLPLAKEAYFSAKEIINSLRQRRRKLDLVLERKGNADLKTFLQNDFDPFFTKICSQTGSSKLLKEQYRTLSPSDFGFHNALKKKDGQIVFLDMEYFGWDDPAKMIADFLLHPQNKIKKTLKARFVNKLLVTFSQDQQLRKRLKIYYPLLGLKWCLILLNEFLPSHWARRRFAKGKSLNKKEVCQRQLRKAQNMLKMVSSI